MLDNALVIMLDECAATDAFFLKEGAVEIEQLQQWETDGIDRRQELENVADMRHVTSIDPTRHAEHGGWNTRICSISCIVN